MVTMRRLCAASRLSGRPWTCLVLGRSCPPPNKKYIIRTRSVRCEAPRPIRGGVPGSVRAHRVSVCRGRKVAAVASAPILARSPHGRLGVHCPPTLPGFLCPSAGCSGQGGASTDRCSAWHRDSPVDRGSLLDWGSPWCQGSRAAHLASAQHKARGKGTANGIGAAYESGPVHGIGAAGGIGAAHLAPGQHMGSGQPVGSGHGIGTKKLPPPAVVYPA